LNDSSFTNGFPEAGARPGFQPGAALWFHHWQMTPLSQISLSDDLNADIGSTAHANGSSSTETEINRCAIAERTAIIDPDDHRPIVAWIGDADSRAKRECPVRRSQSMGIELLARCRASPSEFIAIISRSLSVGRALKAKEPNHEKHYCSHC
jgi:hypothetical protein